MSNDDWEVIEIKGKTAVKRNIDITTIDKESIINEFLKCTMIIAEDTIETQGNLFFTKFGYFNEQLERREIKVTIEILETNKEEKKE
jgi:hypothetical protein